MINVKKDKNYNNMASTIVKHLLTNNLIIYCYYYENPIIKYLVFNSNFQKLL